MQLQTPLAMTSQAPWARQLSIGQANPSWQRHCSPAPTGVHAADSKQTALSWQLPGEVGAFNKNDNDMKNDVNTGVLFF